MTPTVLLRRVRDHAPGWEDPVRAALPRAADTVRRRLLAALCREDIGDARSRYGAGGRWSAFGHVTFDTAPPVPLAALVPAGGGQLLAELDNAVGNQAIAYARHGAAVAAAGPPDPAAGAALASAATRCPGAAGGPAHPPAGAGRPADRDGPAAGHPGWGALGVDAAVAAAERWAVEGHNLHPCGRTRLGWSVPDVWAHDLESPATAVRFVAVPAAAHRGDDVGELLRRAGVPVPQAPAGHVVQPVHAWQWQRLRRRHGGELMPLEGSVAATPTLAVRTLLLAGPARYLKLSLDVQITSTRRTISAASAHNGPRLSTVLAKILDGDPAGERALVLEEPAGAAVPGVGDGRAASAIVRDAVAGRLVAGERVWPAAALPAVGPDGRAVVASLVDRFAARYGYGDAAAAGAAFLVRYARLLLTPVLRLAARYGVGLEAHLQNCLPTFVDGAPHRMVFRDLAGLRVHRGRLAAAGLACALHPASVVGTDDVGVLRAKVGYTAFQAHLAEVVRQVVDSHGVEEAAVWAAVRELVDDIAGGDVDHGAWTAPTMPHKALVRMRLQGSGDVYVPVPNPLCGAVRRG
ncbi:MAG TPA: IucA/IucC family protein [Pilimelia sp.]|nr:IucA/IucC family protein [Pilimelia sp.]